MSKKNGKKPEKPVFDFSHYPLSTAQEHSVNYVRLAIAERGDDYDLADELQDKIDGMLSKVIVSIPRSWLIEGAPEKIDWSKPSSLEYISGVYNTELETTILEGVIPEENVVFDISKFSRKDGKKMQRLESRAKSAVNNLDIDNYNEVSELLFEFVARFIKVLPRCWFVDNAPDDLEITDYESFEWLRGDLWVLLVGGLATAILDRKKK